MMIPCAFFLDLWKKKFHNRENVSQVKSHVNGEKSQVTGLNSGLEHNNAF